MCYTGEILFLCQQQHLAVIKLSSDDDRPYSSGMNQYIFGSRLLTHVAFWVLYYLAFGFIWTENGDYFSSYFLEFVLLPVRVLATYVSLYWLVPRFLSTGRFGRFAGGYLLLIVLAGSVQRVFTFYYYDYFLKDNALPLWSLAAFGQNLVLINSTVLFVTALKVIKLWHEEKLENKRIRARDTELVFEVKADKRIYRLRPAEIKFVESLGNYVTFHLVNKKIVSYMSLSDVAEALPANFIRVHKSYLINRDFISSYNNEDIEVDTQKIPLGRAFKSQWSELI